MLEDEGWATSGCQHRFLGSAGLSCPPLKANALVWFIRGHGDREAMAWDAGVFVEPSKGGAA